jgi:hypothetical protein
MPDRGEQIVRYYGYHSNVSGGKRKETEGDGVPCILKPDKSPKEYRKNWARLIQKIYEVDPLTCPKCWGIMRILALCEAIDYVKMKWYHLPKVRVFVCVPPGIAMEKLHIILPVGLHDGTISD